MVTEVKAPTKYSRRDENGKRRMIFFLAGSIEMGTAKQWQSGVVDALKRFFDSDHNYKDIDILVLNPRRDEWNENWVQDISNPQFREQVEWELDGLEEADGVIFYFDPNTFSPISLLELGLLAKQGRKSFVCCPDGYWRKGNVQVVCAKYGIPLVDSLDDIVKSMLDG